MEDAEDGQSPRAAAAPLPRGEYPRGPSQPSEPSRRAAAEGRLGDAKAPRVHSNPNPNPNPNQAGTGLAAAARALTSRAIPSLGSVLRAACLPHAPAAALLGASCDAALAGSSLLLSLPAAAAAAEAGLAALLPSLPHALAQAGAPGLLRLR